MPDTNRSKADLAALLADNTTALISAQDVRDFLESVFTLGTKGDLAGIDVAGLRQALTVGTDGKVLTADAASTLGFKWETAGAGAHPDLATHDALGLATDAELTAHTGDTSDAHDASAISVDSTTLVGTGTDVQAVLEELDNGIADHLADTTSVHAHSSLGSVGANDHHNQSHGNGDHTTAFTDDTTVNNHIADTGDAHDASAISVDSTTLVGVGTDVQAVLEELDNGIADHLADTTDAHDSDSIAYVPTTAADWGPAGDPGDVEQALDVLADRTSKQLLYIPGWQLIPSFDRAAYVTTPGVSTVSTNDFAYRFQPFSGTAKQYAAGDFMLPPNYDASTLTARFRWKSIDGSGTVIWGIQMLSTADDDAHDAAMGTAIEVTDTLTTIGDYQRSDMTGAITPSGTAAAGDHIWFEIYRDGTNDTHGSTVQLIGVEIYFGLTHQGVA